MNYVNQPSELGHPHLIIIPGTKSTVADLAYLRRSGLAESILAKARAGTPVVGICGGYQMLGEKVFDPKGVESPQAEVAGLGLLPLVTEFAPEKSTRQVKATVLADLGLLAGAAGLEVAGYEIHMGQTRLAGSAPAFRVGATPEGPTDYTDGAIDSRGLVMGTYLHGLFSNDAFRLAFLNNLRRLHGLAASPGGATVCRDREYDKLADLVRGSLDMAQVYRILEGQA